MKKTPLQIVKEKFETKANLVAAVQALATPELFLDRVNEVKGLARVSNEKLLRLHELLTTLKDTFGSRSALIDSIAKLEVRKDEGFKTRLAAMPTPRLMDEYRAASRRSKRAAAAAKKTEGQPAPVKKKTSRSKKAKAKVAAKKA